MSFDLGSLRARYLDAQLKGDRREALRLVVDDGLRRGAPVRDIQLQVIQEAQRAIGLLWQENRISVAQEHMATAISHLALAHLFEQAEPEPGNGKRVLVACVEGEHHDFPARIAADILELAGFSVRFLGANVPTDSLVAILAAEAPDLLALSVTMTFNVSALRDAFPRLRAALPAGVPILVGGHASAWAKGLVQELGADGTAADADGLVQEARRLLRLRS